MIINISSKSLEYNPRFSKDNPDWKKKYQWHTITPQKIGDYDCFVKRFDHPIKGWPLIERLVGLENTGIPKVLATSQEESNNNGKISYLIQEFIQGDTLKKNIRTGFKIDLPGLVDDIWLGLSSLHKRGYWHTDFCEENIFFSQKENRYYLIDLDSIESVSTTPSPVKNMPGWFISKELAIVARNYIADYVDTGISSRFDSFNGIILNQLQLVALVAKIAYLNSNKKIHPKDIRGKDVSDYLRNTGDIAKSYLSAAWQHKNIPIISPPVIKTIIKHHFPKLEKPLFFKSKV